MKPRILHDGRRKAHHLFKIDFYHHVSSSSFGHSPRSFRKNKTRCLFGQRVGSYYALNLKMQCAPLTRSPRDDGDDGDGSAKSSVIDSTEFRAALSMQLFRDWE
jgi:hypothetical protein